MKNKSKKPINLKYLWMILLLFVWEGIAKLSIVSPIAFPSLKLIGLSFVRSVISGEILYQIVYSIGLILVGMLLAVFLAVVLSSLSILNDVMKSFIDTCVSIFHPLPGIALLPLIILWIGTGSKAVIFIIIHSVVWPMILNTTAGFESIPEIYKKIGHNYELNTIEIIFKIYIPASLPYILAGLKIGWARAWRASISAEMIFGATGGLGGIGWYIFNKRVFMDTPGLFAGLIIIVIIGIIIEDLVFGKIENVTIKKWGIQT